MKKPKSLPLLDDSDFPINRVRTGMVRGTGTDIDELKETHKNFKNLVKKILENHGKEKLIIFVDELDRCNPENAIKLLESIKNNFEIAENCGFVIFVDDEVLASYINKKYEKTEMNGYLYLEKVVEAKFRVPEIDLSYLENFFRKFDFDLSLLHLYIPLLPNRLFLKCHTKIRACYKLEQNQG